MRCQIIIIALIILLIFIYFGYQRTDKIISSVDNEHYNVVGEYEDAHMAADTLAIVNRNMINFLTYMKNKYNINCYNCGDARQHSKSHHRLIAQRIVENYNPEVIFENPPGSGDTSYTVDKGKKLMMCLRKENGYLHDPHTVTFVALHEVAHMGNQSWGHGDDFWEVFKFILKEAKQAGIHQPIDYSRQPIRYCGLDINHNPYFDPSINDI